MFARRPPKQVGCIGKPPSIGETDRPLDDAMRTEVTEPQAYPELTNEP